MKVLMVCLGNICRSPIAEGILQHKVNQNGLAVEVDSAGTAGYHEGELPDPRSIAVMDDNQIDIRDQRSRKFSPADFDQFDRIYAMDRQNYQDIIAQAKNEADQAKVHLILNASNPGQNLSVPDPYYGGDQGFNNVYQMLDDACEVIVNEIQNQ